MARILCCLTVISALLPGLTGCGSTTPVPGLDYEPPKVSVAAVNVLEETDEGVRVAVTLQAVNTNTVALPLKDVEYTVSISDVGSVSLVDAPNRTLPASGSQQVLLTAALATQGSSTAGKSYTIKGRMNYEPPGEVRRLLTETYVPLPSSEFTGTGTLEFSVPESSE